MLVVLDGWGLRAEKTANAIELARTPVYGELRSRFPHTSLVASGEAVGLPAGQMGNSEVGHMNMGAGRIVYQDLTRIDASIASGEFFANAALAEAMDRCRQDRHALHVVGLVSDGGVHSHQRHLYALMEMAARRTLRRVFVHAFTDGRDTAPTRGATHIGELEQRMARLGAGRIASVSGRYYAMDRDRRWERTQRAYDALVAGAGRTGSSALERVQASYAAGLTDEFIEPAVMVDAAGTPLGRLSSGDSVICFNFRADRVRQLTRALTFAEFDGFDRPARPDLHCTTMTEYDATFTMPVAFPPQAFTANLGEVLAAHGLSNLRLAETEKYAHVTYFFNCGEERLYHGEDRILVPSPKVPTYDLKPDMSAPTVTDVLVDDLQNGRHDVIICNFANADMVGHTGRLEAAVAAVETLDRCLGRIAAAARTSGGTVLVTADHGNAEQMWDPETNGPHTAHTSNPVPLVLVDDVKGIRLRDDGSLRDVAPTILGMLGIPLPPEMSGRDLRY